MFVIIGGLLVFIGLYLTTWNFIVGISVVIGGFGILLYRGIQQELLKHKSKSRRL